MLINQHVDNLKIVHEKNINLSRNQIGRILKNYTMCRPRSITWEANKDKEVGFNFRLIEVGKVITLSGLLVS